ncbi:MAG: hypothetical protein AAGU19_10470 [Prolixibacteraceae bacterium]
MKKRFIYPLSFIFIFLLVVANVSIIATSSTSSLNLQALKSEACEVFPEGWGTVLLMRFGICDVTGGGSGIYGCYDANDSCNPW